MGSTTGEINPFHCTDRDLVSLNHLVFESIVGFDEEMKPAPLLADSWTVSGKEWTFKLREGVVFHNGAPQMREYLVPILDELIARGYTFGTVSELMGWTDTSEESLS